MKATVYCLAASDEAARVLALKAFTGEWRSPYASEAECLEGWRSQPSFMASRFLPYRVDSQRALTGFLSLATNRLDKPN